MFPFLRNRPFLLTTLCLIVVAVACLILWLPVLEKPSFSLLDDGVSLLMGSTFSRNPAAIWTMDQTAGRFRPAYWMILTFIFLFAKQNVVRWFAVNFLVLLASALGIFGLARLRAQSRLQATLAAILFIFTCSTVEAYFTLSKSEHWVVLFSLIAILAAIGFSAARRLWQKIAALGVCLASAWLTVHLKETGLVLPALSLAWLALGWLRRKHFNPADRLGIKARAALAACAVLAAAAWFITRSALGSAAIAGSTYAKNFDLSNVSMNFSLWGEFLLHNSGFLLLLLPVLLIPTVRRQMGFLQLLDWLTWAAGFALIYLPWSGSLLYFFLPATVGLALLGGALLASLILNAAKAESIKTRSFSIVMLLFFFSAWLMNLLNVSANAQVQTQVDRLGQQVVDHASHLPKDSTLYLNISKNNEIVFEMGLHLQLRGRKDIKVEPLDYATLLQEDPRTVTILSPQTNTALDYSVRTGIPAGRSQDWGLCLNSFLNDRGQVSYTNAGTIDVIETFPERLLTGFKPNQKPLLLRQSEIKVSWSFTEVTLNPAQSAQPAVFTDGTWTFRLPSGQSRALRFGQAGDVPLVGDFDGDGWDEIGVFRPSDLTWYVDTTMDGQADTAFIFEGMQATDMPLMGDWDGNGTATPGFFRPSDVSWHLRASLTTGKEDWPVFQFGLQNDLPLVGDWDGNGRDLSAIYRPGEGLAFKMNLLPESNRTREIYPQLPGAPVSAGWSGLGRDSVAFVKDGQWLMYPFSVDCRPPNPPTPLVFPIGDGIPLAGRWDFR